MLMAMICMLASGICNIILDPIFIFGLGPVPRMGIEGAAWATGLSQSIGVVVYIVCYKVGKLPMRIRFGKDIFDMQLTKNMYSVGIPASLNIALPSLLISCLNVILYSYMQVYVFVLGAYYKLQMFLYMPVNGIVQGMRPIIGYNYGAKEYARVQKIYTTALAMSACIMTVGTILCWAIPEQLIGLFSESADTIEIGSTALRIISIGFIVSSVSVISCGALEGLGKGTPSLTISLLRYVLIIIPAAYILSKALGDAVGVWHAFWITEILTAILAYIQYRRVTTVMMK